MRVFLAGAYYKKKSDSISEKFGNVELAAQLL